MKPKLSNPNIWKLYTLCLNHGYWSGAVKEFNSTISEPEKSKINNIVLELLKNNSNNEIIQH